MGINQLRYSNKTYIFPHQKIARDSVTRGPTPHLTLQLTPGIPEHLSNPQSNVRQPRENQVVQGHFRLSGTPIRDPFLELWYYKLIEEVVPDKPWQEIDPYFVQSDGRLRVLHHPLVINC